MVKIIHLDKQKQHWKRIPSIWICTNKNILNNFKKCTIDFRLKMQLLEGVQPFNLL